MLCLVKQNFVEDFRSLEEESEFDLVLPGGVDRNRVESRAGPDLWMNQIGKSEDSKCAAGKSFLGNHDRGILETLKNPPSVCYIEMFDRCFSNKRQKFNNSRFGTRGKKFFEESIKRQSQSRPDSGRWKRRCMSICCLEPAGGDTLLFARSE